MLIGGFGVDVQLTSGLCAFVLNKCFQVCFKFVCALVECAVGFCCASVLCFVNCLGMWVVVKIMAPF